MGRRGGWGDGEGGKGSRKEKQCPHDTVYTASIDLSKTTCIQTVNKKKQMKTI